MEIKTTLTPQQKDALVAEEWRIIPSHPGYEINRFGAIRNKQHKKKLSNRITKNGYMYCNLWENGENCLLLVHRALAETFLGLAPTSKHNVAHFDGNKLNNDLSNLRWATPSENTQDKWRHGKMPIGEQTNSVKLKESQIKEIRRMYFKGEFPVNDIASIFNIDRTTIWRIANRITWKHV